MRHCSDSDCNIALPCRTHGDTSANTSLSVYGHRNEQTSQEANLSQQPCDQHRSREPQRSTCTKRRQQRLREATDATEQGLGGHCGSQHEPSRVMCSDGRVKKRWRWRRVEVTQTGEHSSAGGGVRGDGTNDGLALHRRFIGRCYNSKGRVRADSSTPKGKRQHPENKPCPAVRNQGTQVPMVCGWNDGLQGVRELRNARELGEGKFGAHGFL